MSEGPAPMEVPSEPSSESTPEVVAPDSGGALGSSWVDGLDSDLRQEPTLQRFKSQSDLAKSYMELRTKVGQQGILKPKDDAAPEEWSNFWDEIGRPETPSDYSFVKSMGENPTPGGEEMRGAALEAFHQAGITDAQAETLYGWFAEAGAKANEDLEASHQMKAQEWSKELSKRWGTAAEKRHALAERAFSLAFGEGAYDVAQSTLPGGGKLRDYPDLLDAFANIGQLLAEHELMGDEEPSRFSATPESAQAELQTLKADPKFRAALFGDPNAPEHRIAKERWERLHSQAHPGVQAESIST